jgi:hypothetical protein
MRLFTVFLITVPLSIATIGSTQAQVVINEVCAANGDIVYDPDFFQFPAWIELYNSGNTSVDVGEYLLSDNPGIPAKWALPPNTIIPSKGYLIIWCDKEDSGLHTNFSLDPDGETLVFQNASGQVVDQVSYPKQFTNTSFGRISDGAGTWNHFAHPTPGAENTGASGSTILQKVDYSLKSGRYSGPVTVVISHERPEVTIRFTLDGSEPTHESTVYTAPLAITKTSTLKAKPFLSGFLPGKTEVKTYFINEHTFTLPVIAISTNPAYLYDNTIGIHVEGTNGITGKGSTSPVNWNHDWWRHADLEFFKTNGEKEFDESVDIRIFGNYSRRRPQKSFAVKAREKYGDKTIDKKLFPNKTSKKYGAFILRNSGSEWNVTHFRDALVHRSIAGEMDLDYQDHKPYAIYLNGVYWGILNMREKIDGDYFASNYSLPEGEIDLVQNGSERLGSEEHYKKYLDSLTSRVNISDPNTIRFIERNIDVQEFINYYCTNLYFANIDWPHNNMKYWRPQTGTGKWRWILYDTDFSLGYTPDKSTPFHASLDWVTDPTLHSTDAPTRHFRTLIQNPVFKKRFIQTMTTSLQTTFETERLTRLINEFQDDLKTEMPYHRAKWGSSISTWNNNVQIMRDFVAARNAYLIQHMSDFFALDDRVSLTVKITPESAGQILLNGISQQQSLHDANYFFSLPFEAVARQNPGYTFSHWSVSRRKFETKEVFGAESIWKYFDKGTTPGPDWTATDFNDGEWAAGHAKLGYGEGNENTKVSFGPSSSNKYVTTYFRKEFTISPGACGELNVSVLFDDGVVVYLNGVEVYRENMPAGEVTNSTLAKRTVQNATTFSHFVIDRKLLVEGKNVIAASVHQASVTSSDLAFDLKIEAVELGDIEQYSSTIAALADKAYSDVHLEAVFEPVPAITGVVINEFSGARTIVTDDFNQQEDWIELYNSTTNAVDIAGLFMTDNPDNKMKFRIPGGTLKTIIPAGGYLMLWADEDQKQGPTHLNFRLAAGGEFIGLYQAVGPELVTIDEIQFGRLNENESFSRIPNGTGPFVATTNITPGSENAAITSVERNPVIIGLYPNPVKDLLIIESTPPLTRVIVLDMFGRLIRQLHDLSPGDAVDLSGLESGLYFVKVWSGEKSEAVRIVKK